MPQYDNQLIKAPDKKSIIAKKLNEMGYKVKTIYLLSKSSQIKLNYIFEQ